MQFCLLLYIYDSIGDTGRSLACSPFDVRLLLLMEKLYIYVSFGTIEGKDSLINEIALHS